MRWLIPVLVGCVVGCGSGSSPQQESRELDLTVYADREVAVAALGENIVELVDEEGVRLYMSKEDVEGLKDAEGSEGAAANAKGDAERKVVRSPDGLTTVLVVLYVHHRLREHHRLAAQNGKSVFASPVRPGTSSYGKGRPVPRAPKPVGPRKK